MTCQAAIVAECTLSAADLSKAKEVGLQLVDCMYFDPTYGCWSCFVRFWLPESGLELCIGITHHVGNWTGAKHMQLAL